MSRCRLGRGVGPGKRNRPPIDITENRKPRPGQLLSSSDSSPRGAGDWMAKTRHHPPDSRLTNKGHRRPPPLGLRHDRVRLQFEPQGDLPDNAPAANHSALTTPKPRPFLSRTFNANIPALRWRRRPGSTEASSLVGGCCQRYTFAHAIQAAIWAQAGATG